MTQQDERSKVVETLPEVDGISEEAVANAKAMIGMRLRTEQFTRDASLGALLNFVNGIGDANPLFRDQEYAANTKYGSVIGHPCAPYMRHWSGRTRWGLPGIHGFFAGNDWEFFRVMRPGDAVNCVERVLDVQEKESRYSAKLVIQYVETIYSNQRDELVARVVGWCTRHQRKASRERGKYANIPKRHQYTEAELEAIDEQVLKEDYRGSRPRYWEDTKIGEELDPVVRGPLSLQDVSAFLVGTGRSSAHGVLLREALRHPGHFFRNPEAGGGLEYTGIGHMRDSVAEAVGVPGAYDYGPQRVSWMGTLLTNWMGDDAFLKRLRIETRRFNVYGDTQWCKGKVVRKYVHDGAPLVDLEIWAENQRGELTAPGHATVMLPSRDPKLPWFTDGSGLKLREVPRDENTPPILPA
ncbi:MAG: MaoC family dehydratase N-terminal domain-containing protein [Dehalococcoidia bacterium]|jgi:acyl dehydratase|nr:MaoC family dehydratase N-terminal domain-containing protein [Dehalococcoidia bacterium]MDP6226626.1 MaoC family dehydratase N-terminal domain-containing protein [Dehalococcoidia bacterium]MDP7083857.1 MaoC family dehydratase N-terminal domain-containing protein [Dehalococcoidia bacterium]MDP7201017.1 MaoC family dehydratase N-terminal domain-containing protein [Dehalococcoidia bacterium]MDP7510560.1 MaoC family dehydratase N-terminal domain-containing protein [Dehalococcoidia bacterium]